MTLGIERLLNKRDEITSLCVGVGVGLIKWLGSFTNLLSTFIRLS
jgi:hypothetical protein